RELPAIGGRGSRAPHPAAPAPRPILVTRVPVCYSGGPPSRSLLARDRHARAPCIHSLTLRSMFPGTGLADVLDAKAVRKFVRGTSNAERSYSSAVRARATAFGLDPGSTRAAPPP